jgi:1,4-alpha-glucan branching enzyme
VRSFLISNAVFWLDEYHVDGIRVDAVSSMIYRNYGRTEYLPNVNGGVDNIEAVSFLRQLNQVVRKNYPHAMMIAEDAR